MNGAWFKGLVLMAPWLTLVLILAMFSPHLMYPER